MRVGNSVRSVCGRVRIMYDTEWSRERPYIVFKEGTQTFNSKSLDQAVSQCTYKYGVLFDQDKIDHANESI